MKKALQSELYDDKPVNYFEHIREDIISLMPVGENKVLEIGCGNGATLEYLRKIGKAKEIVGIDIQNASLKLDNYISGNVENMEIPYPDGYFDVVICADVLEHLVNPWEVLRKLRLKLNPKGVILASVPNIREIQTLSKIVFSGSFEYEQYGILDNSHLRFFCKKDILNMFEVNGFAVTEIKHFLGGKRRMANAITLNLFEEFFVIKYVVVGIVKPS